VIVPSKFLQLVIRSSFAFMQQLIVFKSSDPTIIMCLFISFSLLRCFSEMANDLDKRGTAFIALVILNNAWSNGRLVTAIYEGLEMS